MAANNADDYSRVLSLDEDRDYDDERRSFDVADPDENHFSNLRGANSIRGSSSSPSSEHEVSPTLHTSTVSCESTQQEPSVID